MSLRPADAAGRLPAREAAWTARLRGSLGRPLQIHAELDSAMDLAHALGEAGAPAGTCVVADHQRQGRGRAARQWHDRPGESLLLALLLRPDWEPAAGGLLALAGGLAAFEAAAAQGLRLALKWPNDLLGGGRKVAGILSEARLSAGGYRQLVLGLGVNVHQRSESFPAELRAEATSLDLLADRRLDRAGLCADFLAALEGRLPALAAGLQSAAAAALRAEWTARWAHAGRWARDERGQRLRLLGLAEDGALRVAGAQGEVCLRAGVELQIIEESPGGTEEES